MLVIDSDFSAVLKGDSMQTWPTVGRAMMQQLLDAPFPPADRRKLARSRYFLQTELLTTGVFERTLPVFTRDVNAWNVGFICDAQLTIGQKAVVILLNKDGKQVAEGCRVRRCQEFQSGWFDGFVEFNHPQFGFDNL